MIRQVSPNLSRTVSSEAISISRIENKVKKMSTLHHLVFLKLQKNRYFWSFHIAKRMSLQLSDSWQNSINLPIKSFIWLLNGSLRKLKFYFLWKRRTFTQCAKFIEEGVFVTRSWNIYETFYNVAIQYNKHEDICNESETAQYLMENLNYKFKWESTLQAPKNYRQ